MAHFLLESADFVRFVRHPQQFNIVLKMCDSLPQIFRWSFSRALAVRASQCDGVASCFFSAKSVS
jgi:hypothetical protein